MSPSWSDDPAHQLDVEEALPGLALARLAHGSERLVEDVVERLAVLDPLLELGGLREQLGVGQSLEIGLERGDVRGLLRKALEAAALAEAEDLLEPAEARGGHGQRVPASRGAAPAPTFPNGLVMRPSRARAHDAHVKRIAPCSRRARRRRADRHRRCAAHAGTERRERRAGLRAVRHRQRRSPTPSAGRRPTAGRSGSGTPAAAASGRSGRGRSSAARRDSAAASGSRRSRPPGGASSG